MTASLTSASVHRWILVAVLLLFILLCQCCFSMPAMYLPCLYYAYCRLFQVDVNRHKDIVVIIAIVAIVGIASIEA